MPEAINIATNDTIAKRVLLLLVLADFVIFLFSGVGFHSLYEAPFFDFGVDFFYIIFYYLQIPQFIVNNLWLGYLLDTLIIFLLALLLIKPTLKYLPILLFFLLFTYYITLTGYHTHSNYQIGFVLVAFPFLFNKEKNRHITFECLRYYLLFFYSSKY